MTKTTIIGVCVLAVAFIAVFLLRRSRSGSGQADEFPLIYNVANFTSPAELKAVEKAVRERGEQYLISIAVVSSNHAQVRLGDGASLGPRSGRVYKVARTEERWQIEDDESWKH